MGCICTRHEKIWFVFFEWTIEYVVSFPTFLDFIIRSVIFMFQVLLLAVIYIRGYTIYFMHHL